MILQEVLMKIILQQLSEDKTTSPFSTIQKYFACVLLG